MRVLFWSVVAAALICAGTPMASQPAAGSLTCRVVTGVGPDARPVRRARVTLLGSGVQRITDTDTKGAFRFDRLPAGELKVAVEKPGFVKLASAAAPGATLTMTRGAAIEGVVADEAGNPLLNVVVSAMHPGPNGKPVVAMQVRTDDLGRYRLHSLAAGEYQIEAATDRAFVAREILFPGERPPGITRAYHPAAATIDQARAVRVVAGSNTAGIDVVLVPAAPTVDPAAAPPPPRPEPSGTGRVFGRIVAGDTGKPIAGARINLVGVEGVRLTNWKRPDSQGRFEYTGLAARHYQLTVQADRYVSVEYGRSRPGETGTPILLRDGESFRADVTLPRAPAIEGTLLDEFGDPAPGVLVQPARKQFVADRHRLMPVAGGPTAVTDDRGRYRVTVPAGDYVLVALSGAFADQNAVGGFAPTFYPGTLDAGGAMIVTAAPGGDAIAAPFPLVPARTLTLSGMMVDAEGRPVGRGTLWLATPDRLKRMDFHLARGNIAPDGTFALRNVPQGMYTLQGFGSPAPGGRGPRNLGAMPFGWLPVSVGDADLDNVTLKVTNGTTLRGRIVFDDSATTPAAAREVHVTALPIEFDSAPVGGGPPPSQTRDDLTFEVTHLSGLRRVLVSVSSPGWALKTITLDGRDITDEPVDFREKDVEGVEVVLTPKVSVVSGLVTDDKGKPVTDYAVVVFASDASKWNSRSRFLVTARPNQEGRFEVRALPPEEYLVVALPSVILTEWMDPEFLQQLRPIATTFRLGEGEARTLSLTLKRPSR